MMLVVVIIWYREVVGIALNSCYGEATAILADSGVEHAQRLAVLSIGEDVDLMAQYAQNVVERDDPSVIGPPFKVVGALPMPLWGHLCVK